MFSHYATRKISPICKISTFSEDLNFLNPRSHLKMHMVKFNVPILKRFNVFFGKYKVYT